jgi:hypothetical protein
MILKGTLACALLLKMSILKMSSNTEIREKGECAAVRAVGQGLCNWLNVINWKMLTSSYLTCSKREDTYNRRNLWFCWMAHNSTETY